MTREEKLTEYRKIRANLIIASPFFGSIAMMLEPEIEEKNEDGEDEYLAAVDKSGRIYLPDAFFKLNRKEQCGVIAHEIMHIALSHLERIGSRNITLWNIATDAVINDSLSGEFTMPKNIVLDRKLSRDDMDNIINAEKVYEKLTNGNQNKNNGNGLTNAGFDKHIYKGSGQPLISKEELSKIVSSISKLPGGERNPLLEEIKSILFPKLDWRKILTKYLRRMITDFSDWSRPKEYLYEYGIFPRLKIDDVKLHALVALDVSGSINNEMLSEFIGATYEIINQMNADITVIQFDTSVRKVEKHFTPSRNYKVFGRGGTDFNCIRHWIRENRVNADVLIIISDGYADNSDINFGMETIFLIKDNPNFRSNFGRVIHLNGRK